MSHMAVFHYLQGKQVIKYLLDSVVSPPTVRTLFHTLSLPVLNTSNACSPHTEFYNRPARKKKEEEEKTQLTVIVSPAVSLVRHQRKPIKYTVVLRGISFQYRAACRFSAPLPGMTDVSSGDEPSFLNGFSLLWKRFPAWHLRMLSVWI